jgi:hypothetical protein
MPFFFFAKCRSLPLNSPPLPKCTLVASIFVYLHSLFFLPSSWLAPLRTRRFSSAYPLPLSTDPALSAPMIVTDEAATITPIKPSGAMDSNVLQPLIKSPAVINAFPTPIVILGLGDLLAIAANSVISSLRVNMIVAGSYTLNTTTLDMGSVMDSK